MVTLNDIFEANKNNTSITLKERVYFIEGTLEGKGFLYDKYEGIKYGYDNIVKIVGDIIRSKYDLIQMKFNIFDFRNENPKYLEYKKQKAEIFAEINAQMLQLGYEIGDNYIKTPEYRVSITRNTKDIGGQEFAVNTGELEIEFYQPNDLILCCINGYL